jgi:manganese transport protein
MDKSLSEVHSSVDAIKQKTGTTKFLAFLGPAYLVSVGYMDPGNWATDIAGGSKYGYSLVWVLLMSNIMALLLQSMAARLGIVRGVDLAQANRETYPPFINFILYILAEIAIAACDLAEVLGMALGIKLLTGLPLTYGVLITFLDTFLLLYLQRLGIRKMEAFIMALVAVIFIAFFIQIFLAKPDLVEVGKGFIPSIPDSGALFIITGIIGATVMPHNLYLHSALVQTRKFSRTEKGIKEALKLNNIDTTIALNLAFFVNAGILVLAGTLFYKSGNYEVAQIEQAHKLLPSFLGSAAPILFAVALICAGQSSTVTGTLAGQIIMEGYLNLRLSPILRRIITRLIAIVPAVIVIFVYGESKVDDLLVLSQVILSLQLGFAIIPLIYFVSDKSKMGAFKLKPIFIVLACIIAAILVSLNAKMLFNEIAPIYATSSWFSKTLLLLAAAAAISVLAYVCLFPFFTKQKQGNIKMHPVTHALPALTIPVYKKVALALDFSKDDFKIIEAALGQGNINTTYHLIHVVESASALLHGNDTYDEETQQDLAQLQSYAAQIQELGFKAETYLGFKNRVTEISDFVKSNNIDMLVMGAHGHKGIKDLLYGQTVNAVRHEVKVPVLVVNL